jgi:phage FluMu protein Com
MEKDVSGGGSMEIKFSMKLKPDGKTVRVEMRCTECQTELQMAQSAAGMRFRCPKHGELGTLSAEEFADGLRQAQEKARRTIWTGWGGSNEGDAGRADCPVAMTAGNDQSAMHSIEVKADFDAI